MSKLNKFFIAFEEQSEALIEEEMAPELVEETVPAEPEEITDDTASIIEAEEISADIDSDIEETQRAEDVSDALESLCEIISRMEAPTPMNVAMIKLTANMAVAGTPVAANALFSANEDFTDLSVTVEGIQDKIASVGRVITGSISEIAGKVMNFIRKIVSAYERYNQRLAKVKALLAEVKKAKVAKSVTIGIRANDSLCVDGKYVKNAKEYLDALKATNKTMAGFSELFTAQIVKSNADTVELLKVIPKTGEEATERFLKVFDSYKDDFFGKLVKVPGFTKLSDAEYIEASGEDSADDQEGYVAKDFLGNSQIVVTIPKKGSYDEKNLNEIRTNIYKFYLGSSVAISEKEDKINISFEDVQINYVESLITELEKTLQIAKNYSNKEFKVAQAFNAMKITATAGTIGGAFYKAATTGAGIGAAVGATTGVAVGASTGSAAVAGAAGVAGLATGVYAGAVVGTAVMGKLLGLIKSSSLKMISNMNWNLGFMARVTWRHSNATLNTGLGICEKILSSPQWVKTGE